MTEVQFQLSRLADRTLDMFIDSVLANAPDHKLHQTVHNALLEEKFRRMRARAGKPGPKITLSLPILPLAELEAASVGLAASIAMLEVAVMASSDDTQQFELAVGLEFLHRILDAVKLAHAQLGAMASEQVN